MKYIDFEKISKIMKDRPANSHKGMFGKVLVVAGSYGMAGAAILSALGALRSGAGLVTVSVPDQLFPILQVAVPEAICINRKKFVNKEAYNGYIIGPGLGNNSGDRELMMEILAKAKGPVIIDADGLNNIVRWNLKDYSLRSKGDIILTPHPGEAAYMLGIEKIESRKEAALELANKYGATVVLKGHETLVVTEDGEILCNTTGNPGMATGGTGDVLAGVIGGLAVSGYSPLDATLAGVYYHGLAGNICAEELGEIAMTAGDLASRLPYAFQHSSEENGGFHGNK